MPRRQTIESWIDECLTDTEKDKACSAFGLVHVGGSGTREVFSINLSKKTWDAKSLAKTFQGKAESFAQDLGGVQTFHLLAFFGSNEAQAIHPFSLIEGELSVGADSHVKETADARGMNQMLMRHLETKEKLLVGFIQGVVTQAMQDRQKLQEEVNDAYTIVREMLMNQVKQDSESRMKELEFRRSSEERATVLKILPAALNTLTGKEIVPQSTADTAIVEQMARKFRPEMIQQLAQAGLLSTEEATLLVARFTAVLEKDKSERDELAKAPPANRDPVKDALGEN